jgi:protein subunit release factor B
VEEARLFAGDYYDSGDAVVTVNAGAGGTDSQDWAEMLRTNVEVGNAQAVLDGDLDEFVRAELLRRA